ncbi:complement component 1 Q subcomponent-binding protein, mitochondrial-like [Rhopilema esculentum]|uniref:complement component 1 Q subcomponent-binding protein, mitochondrial-like n=1 Tax=Rhopilema esculentum TaxID=499914 RepID=UPI0031D321DB
MISSANVFKTLSSMIPQVSRHVRASASGLRIVTKRSSSIFSRLRSSSSVLGSRKFQIHDKICSCGIHHKLTEGDHDIVNFLNQEVEYEKEAMQDLPKLKDFKVNVDGSYITLSKKHNGERIIVSFDVNENINIDEAMDDEIENVDDDSVPPNIVSYPTFKVQLTKDSGKTLQFFCAYNTSEQIAEEEEIPDVFRFDSVSVWQYPDAQEEGETSYEAETENMDGTLYKLLLNTLYERGINNEFAKDLLEISTIMEHKEYVGFLQDLNGFFSAKH